MKSGYFLLNKHEGISSFFALKKVQRKFFSHYGEKIKIGHAGTLDPLAQGLLLCGIGKGTKVLSEMILSKKSYTAEIFLGKFSTTDDREGEKFSPLDSFSITNSAEMNSKIPSREEVEKILEKFSGKIFQVPPKYSALKISGKRACDRVRSGEEIEMKSREIEIFQVHILEYNFPILKIFVECGTGTYIRSLARDIGQELGIGAYLHFLCRESVGEFSLSDAKTIEEISPSDIYEFQKENFSLPIIFLSQQQEERVRNGQRIAFFPESEIQEKIVLFGKKSQKCIGFAQRDGRILRPRKLL